jgi:hypothetical protein
LIRFSFLCKSVFYWCDRIPWYLKGEKVYFDSWFQSLVCCPIAFGPVARQNIMEGEQVVEKTAYFIVARKQRVKGRGWSPNIPFRDTPRMT